MKVSIIGANGFLGRNLIEKCLDMGWETHCYYNNSIDFIPNKCELFKVGEQRAKGIKYDVSFFCASHIPYGNMNRFTEKLIEGNILLPIEILMDSIQTRRLVFISSVSVYGINNDEYITEQSNLVSPNTYGLSKLIGEKIALDFSNTSIIRFSSIYGIGMNQNTFIPKVINQAKIENKITVIGNGSRLQDYIHVSDASNLCVLAGLQGDNEVYLGVSGKSISNLAIVNIVSENMNYCKKEFIGTDKSKSFKYNNDFTCKKLNWNINTPLNDGLIELIKSDLHT